MLLEVDLKDYLSQAKVPNREYSAKVKIFRTSNYNPKQFLGTMTATSPKGPLVHYHGSSPVEEITFKIKEMKFCKTATCKHTASGCLRSRMKSRDHLKSYVGSEVQKVQFSEKSNYNPK